MNTALGYLLIAELAEEKAVEVNNFRFAYNSNLAFSIELFIKSIVATSEERRVFAVGGAQITRQLAKSNIKEHKLGALFDKLPEDCKTKLGLLFEKHVCNVSCMPLSSVLNDIENAFVDNRYIFEKGGLTSANESELLCSVF
ncbi:hypothetical protein AKH15_07085 [Vibrio parahaemolyticus]|nr:hypothetical protein AKH15_07085 [Vibrio parahaemolyticus]